MRRKVKRFAAFMLSIVMTLSLAEWESSAVLEGVYFSAANEQLLELSGESMPFYSGDVLYISNRFFEGTELGVRYVKNSSMGLAVLYTTKTDLRFDLVNGTVRDKDGATYSGRAIEKNGYVFFPIGLVCAFFDLRWTMTDTETVPLVRLRSNSSLLDDMRFIDAASVQMASRYAAYEKQVESSKPPVNNDPPPIHAAEGQKVYLILAGESSETTRETVKLLGENRATFLLTVQQMEDGDLLRTLVGTGHAVALLAQEETCDAVRGEILTAREKMWNATHNLMQLVWYEGEEDVAPILEELGCVTVTAEIDRRDTPVRAQSRAATLLTMIGQHREDLPVYLGYDGKCLEGLDDLIHGLEEGQYRLCAWRLNA